MPEVELTNGTIHYSDEGEGEPLMFAHGLLVNGTLWRDVVPRLSDRFRCIVPDLPLGSHPKAMNEGADLSPPGVARLIADFIADIGLERATQVGNDTGGALCQIAAANHPERVERLVLTPCDTYDNFLPPFFRPLQYAAKVPGLLTGAVQGTRLRAIRHGPLGFGLLIKRRPIDPELTDGWVRPFLSDRGVRRDATAFLKAISPRYTIEAAEKLRGFERPTLIAWAPEDRFFKFDHAQRLAQEIPDCRLERIEDSKTFVSIDQPARVAELISDFIGAGAGG